MICQERRENEIIQNAQLKPKQKEQTKETKNNTLKEERKATDQEIIYAKHISDEECKS